MVSQNVVGASVVAYFESRTWIVEKVTIAAAASAAVGPKARAPAR